MVRLERALEGSTAGLGVATSYIRLLRGRRVCRVEIHQAVAVLGLLLAVQSEGQEGYSGQDDRSADTDDDADDGVTRLRGHAGCS